MSIEDKTIAGFEEQIADLQCENTKLRRLVKIYETALGWIRWKYTADDQTIDEAAALRKELKL